MAANQVNFQMFSYVDDNAVTWNKRGEQDTAANAIDGSAPLTAGAPVWPHGTKRFHTRYAIFQDPTTYRSKRIVIYTPTAFAALSGASTLDVNVPGNVAAVTYNLVQKVAEKQPTGRSARQLADHA